MNKQITGPAAIRARPAAQYWRRMSRCDSSGDQETWLQRPRRLSRPLVQPRAALFADRSSPRLISRRQYAIRCAIQRWTPSRSADVPVWNGFGRPRGNSRHRSAAVRKRCTSSTLTSCWSSTSMIVSPPAGDVARARDTRHSSISTSTHFQRQSAMRKHAREMHQLVEQIEQLAALRAAAAAITTSPPRGRASPDALRAMIGFTTQHAMLLDEQRRSCRESPSARRAEFRPARPAATTSMR